MKYGFVLLASLLAAAGCAKSTTTKTPADPPAPVPASTAKATKAAPKKVPKPPHPVPGSWERMVDDVKGFAFSVPEGSESKQESQGGVDVFMAVVPKPHDIAVMAVVYKDASKTKDDLSQNVVEIIQGMGDTDVNVESSEELNDDYSLLTITSKDDQGAATKSRALVATDITDNYILIVASPATEFDANADTVDAIWGSFEMFSGGASGGS